MDYLQILLMRHGESVGNALGQMEGGQSTPLSGLGRWQAACLGRRLATMAPPSQIYCSPLQRAVDTLAHMVAGLGHGMTVEAQPPVPVQLTPDLQEFDNGIFSGLTWAEACRRYPDLCDRMMTSLDWIPIPQAESLAAGRARSRRFWQHVLTHHGNGERLWVISHHWLLEHLIAEILGCDRTWQIPMANTALFEFWCDRSRWHNTDTNRLNSILWQIRHFNDSQHLRQQ
ncbi:histidine phosphatase family protein [Halomicronema hongdechloris C2206]|uniref:Histidine phosphatase family protein n=1 Tax=Halomicronema hongdechloris C2206 TaxID=1641165 RepID=A0A1Z3HSA3_9CYAN|nr:histidine phosphatase family protein [Halomicronema hongdechloris]ASC73191.1 histidine phosphatase family protein [Halomicronema hongdechloris C2206]